jgi:hypothetical protein
MRADIKFFAIAVGFLVAAGCNQAPGPEQGTPPAQQQGATTDSTAPAATVPSTGSGAAVSGGGSGSSGATAAQSGANPVRDQATSSPARATTMAMDVPAGTPLQITLDTAVASDTSKVEDTVRGKVAKAVLVSGMTAIPEGAPVRGTVVAVERAGKVKGRASITVRFNEVTVGHTPYRLQTTRIVREAPATKGEDAKKIGIGAGVGTAIGAIAGGKKGAAIGAGVGGGAGTGMVMATRGEEVRIPAGTTLRTSIDESVRVTAPM